MTSITHGNQREAALIGYLAGILDGEGCIRLTKATSAKLLASTNRKAPMYAAYVQVGMVDRRVCELFKARYGGTIREERVQDRRSIFRWVLSGRLAVPPCLKELLPLLIVKREQAEVLLRYCDETTAPVARRLGVSEAELQRREQAYQRMRKLNAVGAPATTE